MSAFIKKTYSGKPSRFNPALRLFGAFLIYFGGLFLIGFTLWTRKYFGRVTVDQAVSIIYFGLDGLLTADSIYLKRFIVWCLAWPALAALGLAILKLSLARKTQNIAVSINKINRPWIYILLGLALLFHQYHGVEYLHSLIRPKIDYFSLNYINPKQVEIRPKELKSLIIIYVESLETTYSNEKIFGHDLLQPLTKLKNTLGFSFSVYKQMPGTGWTMGGIVATQCGIPIKELTLLDSNRLGQNIKQYLPNAECLSDLLSHYGYQNIFMNGSSVKFAGKDVFLASHHYKEIYGREEWLRLGVPEAAIDGWGLSDHELFEQAKLKVAQLIAQKELFNLTLLTVDTHGFNGRLNDYCKKQGYRDFTGIVECTAAETAEFVQYIKDQGWLDQVNIAIMGDHLAMKNAVYAKLKSAPSRTIFNLFISNEPHNKCYDNIMSFSMMPTLLKFTGFKVEKNRLALGYGEIGRLCHHARPLTYTNELEKDVLSYSKRYSDLWLSKPSEQ